MPIKSGSLSSHNSARPALTASGTLAGGLPTSGSATMALTVSSAELQLIANLSATSTMALTVAAASLGGAVYASGSATMALTVPSATLGALAGISASATMALAATGTMTAIGYLSSGDEDTGLTADQIAQAVWETIVPGGFDAGSAGALMGKLLTMPMFLALKDD